MCGDYYTMQWPTSHEVSNGVEQIIQELMGVLLLHIVKQNCTQDRQEKQLLHACTRMMPSHYIPFSFLTLQTNFRGCMMPNFLRDVAI